MRCAATLLGVALLGSTSFAQSAEDREWNQQRGNAARTGETSLEPIRAEPVETWRQKLSGPVHGEPVTWGGVVFVVAGRTSRRELYAFRADTGARLGKRGLGKGPIARIAVFQGVVIVNDGAQLVAFPHSGKSFKIGWKKPGGWRGAPCIQGGKVLVSDGKLHVLDPKTGNEIGGGAEAHGSVAVREKHTGGLTLAVVAERAGAQTELILRRADLGKDWKAPSGTSPTIGKTASAPGLTFPVLVDAGNEEGAWFVWSGGIVKDTWPSAFVSASGTATGNSIRTLPVVQGGIVYGFDKKGALRGTNTKGRAFDVIPAGRMPGGARPGPASLGKGVACFGNWALELKTDRVLWTSGKIKPASTVVPVADGRMVYATSKNELVGIADPVLVDGGGEGGARSRGMSRPEGPRPRPGADEGVLLASGEVVAGSVKDLEDGRVRFTPAEGEAKDIAVEDVAVYVKDGQVVWNGEENALLQLWREHLRANAAAELEAHVRKLIKAKLLTDARRVLEDLRTVGISDKTGAAIEKLFGRKKEARNAAKKAPKFREAEDKLREKLFAAVLEGVAWCEKRGQNGAAAALLQDCELMIPGRDTIEKRGKELIPKGFPFASEPHPGRLWVQWADKIVPAGARFLAPGDRAWNRVEGPRFAEGKCLAFRTKNLLMFSTEKEMDVVGSCLRNGEGAVRALQRLLNGGEPDPIVADTDRMQVRIFATRKGYMEDGHAPPWSAGVYSPGEGVSRFFVPRRGENKEPMGRNLFDTMSHELTHHYVHSRFMGGRSGRSVDQPGFWIVEGIASFMGDQAIEMGRRGPALDDPTASSIDAAAQAFKKGKLIPMKRYLSLTQYEFARLGDKPIVIVHLKHTIQGRILSERALFYEQAGSLCFYLMNRRDKRGRELLIQYIRSYYRADTKKDNWRDLGFPDPGELEKAYIAFLENPAAK